uniref:hepatitis A virus cellular receptor 2 homolog isoform X1 n=1 Tax=Jaculus jaculus TaxID=51337 RepID=UPI001E1B4C2C|nr:hepatitis A virus cellular receptor 2 homolog isoform X1 [Jaculus jaculus]
MSSRLSFDCVLLLLPLLLTRSLEEAYQAEVGQNASLPCSYILPTPGTLVPVCWGKGKCPLSQCSNLLLNSDNSKVTYQKSSRYQLKGNFHKGDVSLTIQNVTVADSGTFCCRVQFPGIMNDQKLNLELIVKPATVTPQIAQRDSTTVLPRRLTIEGRGPETQTLRTLQDRNETQLFTLTEERQDSAAATRLGAYVGAGVAAGLALTLIVGALVLKWHFHRKRQLQSSSLITLANLPPMGLVNAVSERMRTEENIYTTEENVYEMENSNEYFCYVSSGQPS